MDKLFGANILLKLLPHFKFARCSRSIAVSSVKIYVHVYNHG